MKINPIATELQKIIYKKRIQLRNKMNDMTFCKPDSMSEVKTASKVYAAMERQVKKLMDLEMLKNERYLT